MTLEDEITEAQTYISEPPKNESNTCEWIILLILWALGYARRDIVSRMADSTGQYPDYTLLPNHSSATYYLEAKAWNVALEDREVRQVLDYANHNGKRFVVLTNGQRWRLYDNAIQGLLPDKLITQAALQDTQQITDFLTVISKSEVLNGSLIRKATDVGQQRLQDDQDRQEQQRRQEELQRIQRRQKEIRVLLDTILPELLSDSNDELVVSIANHLSNREELCDISPEIISEWFEGKLSLLTEDQEELSISSPQTGAYSLSMDMGSNTFTLRDLKNKSINGKSSKPVSLQVPDGTTIIVRSWVHLAESMVRWLLQQSYPIPRQFVSSHQTRYFLNDIREHQRPSLRKKFKEISASGKTVYMDADRSGDMFLNDVYALCLEVHVSPDAFRITMMF